MSAPAHGVSFADAFRVWLRVALLSFGGPAGQIAVMHRIVVEEKRWVSEARFLHALNYCHLLPGPEAQQLAIYIGWLMHRVPGGLVAGVLFVVPGMVALMALSWIYAIWGDVGVVAGLFFGLKAAVLAVVIERWRVGRRALKCVAIAAAFTALFLFGVPFPVVVAAGSRLCRPPPRLPGRRQRRASRRPAGRDARAHPPPLLALFPGGTLVLLRGLSPVVAVVSFGAATPYSPMSPSRRWTCLPLAAATRCCLGWRKPRPARWSAGSGFRPPARCRCWPAPWPGCW